MGHRSLAGAVGLALCIAAQVRAGEPTPLPPVVAPLPAEEARPESPSRRDPSGAISVVERAEHLGDVNDAAGLVATAPGVQVQDTGGLLQSKALIIRGASSNGVLVLLDGIPLNGAGGVADLSLVPVAIVDRLEVLRGGAGARYGSGGLGGVVNVVTPPASSGAHAAAEATWGSFGTALGSLAASGSLGDGQGLLLVHGARTRGDFTSPLEPAPPDGPPPLVPRQNNDAAIGGALLKYRRALGVWTLDVLGELSLADRGIAGPAPSPTPDEREDDRRGSAAVRLSRAFDSGAELSARAFLKDDDSRFRGGLFGDLRQRLLSAGAQVEGSLPLGGIHALSAEADVAYEGLAESTGTNPAWGRGGAMAMDELLLLNGALVLAPSLRVDQTGRFTGLSPKLGATALLPWGLELRANAGQAHRAPSFLELYVVQARLLPNPDLRPERSLFGDVALSRKAGALSATAGAFYSLYEDLIAYEYYPPFLARAYNFAAAQVYGAEVEAELKPHPLASARASYTLLLSQNLRDDPRYYLKELPYRPRHTLYGRLVFGPGWLQGRVELNYQSEQFINRTQTASLPARAFVNAGVSTRFQAGLDFTASFEVKNALDVQAQDVDGYPLPGRAAYLTLAAAFDRGPRAP